MQNNKVKFTKKIGEYFQKSTTKVAIICVFIASFFLVVFGLWLYTITFLNPKNPSPDNIMQKRLKVDAKQYQDVITLLKMRKEKTIPAIIKDPFK